MLKTRANPLWPSVAASKEYAAWMREIIAGQINVRDGMEQAARECDQIVADAIR